MHCSILRKISPESRGKPGIPSVSKVSSNGTGKDGSAFSESIAWRSAFSRNSRPTHAGESLCHTKKTELAWLMTLDRKRGSPTIAAAIPMCTSASINVLVISDGNDLDRSRRIADDGLRKGCHFPLGRRLNVDRIGWRLGHGPCSSRKSRKGRDDWARRCENTAKSLRSSRHSSSSVMRARTACRSSSGSARNAVRKTSAVA